MEQQPAVDFEKAVAAYGGFTGLARHLKVPLTTVHGWHRRKKLPPWREQQIAMMATAEKKDVFKRRRKVRQTPRRKRAT